MINLIERRDMMAPRNVTFDDFVEVEYIENTSNAYIDTLIKGSNKISIQLKYIFKKNSGDTNSGFIFGSRVTNQNQEYGIINSYVSQFRFGNNASLPNFIANEDTLVTLDNTENHYEMKILDSSNNLLHTLTTTNNTFSNNLNLYIFGMNNNGSLLAFNSTTKLYSCKIYENDVLVRDFIPVLQVSTRRYGLWDKVEGKFYTSPNGIEFSGMNPMVFDANGNIYWLKNYVQARGYYSYATTPIKAKSTDLIKIGFTVTSRPDTGWCFLIGYYNTESNRFGIYMKSSSYRWTFDFWRGGNGSSRKYADTSIAAPALNKRYDLIVGNPSLTSSTEAYAYDAASDTVLIPSGTTINNTTSSNSYIISENRSGKAGYVTRYYYVKIYKQENGEKVLKFDAIPVQRDSDDVWGFYDKLTNTFYPSNGTEQFTGA